MANQHCDWMKHHLSATLIVIIVNFIINAETSQLAIIPDISNPQFRNMRLGFKSADKKWISNLDPNNVLEKYPDEKKWLSNMNPDELLLENKKWVNVDPDSMMDSDKRNAGSSDRQSINRSKRWVHTLDPQEMLAETSKRWISKVNPGNMLDVLNDDPELEAKRMIWIINDNNQTRRKRSYQLKTDMAAHKRIRLTKSRYKYMASFGKRYYKTQQFR